jgi:hypothetical protein
MGRKTDRQTDRQTGRQTDRQTDRQIERDRDIVKESHTSLRTGQERL